MEALSQQIKITSGSKVTSTPNTPFFEKQSLQKKLEIGSSSDAYEAEADAIADKVMSISDAQANTTPHTGPLVQRKCAQCEQEEKLQKKPLASAVTPLVQRQSHGTEAGAASQALSQQINSSKGSGTGMDNNTRAFMESRFGADFSTVKIHTDNQAVQMSRALNAHAFTVGNDIYFNEGQYKPAHTSGKHLLAHELTHVLQQSNGIQRISRSCTPRSAGECCRAAKHNNLDNGSAGGVVCCDGRKVACNWYYLPDGQPNDFIEDIIETCITEHELTHFDDIDSCSDSCPSLTRPGFKSGADSNEEECEAYRTELECFRNNIARCDTLANNSHKQQCRNVIQNTWIADREQQVANRC